MGGLAGSWTRILEARRIRRLVSDGLFLRSTKGGEEPHPGLGSEAFRWQQGVPKHRCGVHHAWDRCWKKGKP